MEGTKEIKRRIKSVQNTKQITKAMKMVAAAKLRRAQERAENSKPYAAKIKAVINSIAKGVEGVEHPLLEVRDVQKTGYFIITSDRGLAGGYNGNLIRSALMNIKKRHKSQDEYVIFVVGRKGRDFFKKRGYPVIGEITGLSDYPTYADIKDITKKAIAMYAEGKFDALYLVYNRFESAIQQTPTELNLLPLKGMDHAETTNDELIAPYIFEPSAKEVLNSLLPQYAETLIYSAILNAKASEHAARMTAMGNATDNADEMIFSLTLSYNRARQAAITREINEIVSGANALSQ